MGLAIRIEFANVATVQRPHDADAREHRWPARRRHQDQGLHCRLPLCGLVLGLRKLRDVSASILKGYELAAFWQRDRVIESPRPICLHGHQEPTSFMGV